MDSELSPRHSRGDTENEQRKRIRGITSAATAALSCAGIFLSHSDDLQASYEVASYNMKANQTFNEDNDHSSAVASTLLNDDIRVNCDDERLARQGHTQESLDDGFSRIGRVENSGLTELLTKPVITLQESICDTISSFDPAAPAPAESDEQYPTYLYDAWQYSKGIGVVLHELEHIQGVHNEAEANCYAYQKLPQALEELGLEPEVAESGALVATLTEARTPIDEYLSDECRPGGDYDLAISSSYLNYDPEETTTN